MDIFVVNNKEEEVELEENEYQIIYDNSDLTWTSLEYNEDVGVYHYILVVFILLYICSLFVQ